MTHPDRFWSLGHLSDAQLLQSLSGVLSAQRQRLAELIAHLAAVEERRIHLLTAHASMFSYCVGRLGMSEDEACRRIEVARLARKFPSLFPALASGQINLSVAALLKPILTAENHAELIAAACGKTIAQARELLAERLPKPDVPSSLRKLPERRPAPSSHSTPSRQPEPASADLRLPGFVAPAVGPSSFQSPPAISAPSSAIQSAPTVVVAASAQLAQPSTSPPLSALPTADSTRDGRVPALPVAAVSATPVTEPGAVSIAAAAVLTPTAVAAAALRASSAPRIEPLSSRRYRVQFTADADFKGKLERARDLMRHALPSGDFAPILSRALDLLIDDLLRRRFGARAPRKTSVNASTAASGTASSSGSANSELLPASASPTGSASTTLSPTGSASTSASRTSASPTSASPTSASATTPPPSAPSAPASRLVRVAAPTASSAPSPAPACSAAASRHRRSPIPRPERRAVLERDGLGCSWVSCDGVRCGSLAWLELDHRQPAGQGGSSDAGNLRLFCRAHNHLAAEQAYGRERIQRAIAVARRRRAPRTTSDRLDDASRPRGSP